MEDTINLMVVRGKMTSEPTKTTRNWDDLPEIIIQHIQSFFPTTKDGFNSSLVSKTYLRAWSNRPFLRFDDDPTVALHPLFSQSFPLWQIDPPLIRANLIKAIDDTLARYRKHDLTLENFHLAFTVKGHLEAHRVIKWFRLVCRLTGLKEISLDIKKTDTWKFLIHIGEIFFAPKTLETVILRGFINLDEHEIKCSRLRHLELHGVGAGQALLDSLFTACPLIENIILFRCRTFNVVIKVKNLLHLRSFTFFTYSPFVIVEIDNTPNLRSFDYENMSKYPNCTLKIDADPAMTCLNISGRNMYLFDGFLRIGYFTLSGDVINVTSDSLKKLHLSTTSSNNVHPADIHIYAPNLIAFEYNGSSTLPPLSFANDIFTGPCEMRLSTSMPECLDTSYFHKIREILRRSSSGSLVGLCTHRDTKVNIDVHELMMVSHPPRVELKLLRLATDWPIVSSGYDVQIMDAFFLICHPRIVRVCNGVKFNESLRKVLMESESPRCCAEHGQNRCWRHYLKCFVIGFGEWRVGDDDGNITWLPGHEWTENEFALVGYDFFFGLEWLY